MIDVRAPRILAMLVCVISAFGPPWTACAAAAPTKRALLVGIDHYASPDVPTLAGAVHDVGLMESVLETRFEVPPENIVVLLNEQATRAAIISAVETQLIAAAQPGDIVIFHYAGHGSQMQDNSGDELDGWDETIVPYDSRTGTVFDISDDELNGLLREVSRKTPNVTLIFDSCHSGTISRALTLGAVARQAPPDTRTPPAPSASALGSRGLVDGPSNFASPEAGYVLISAARADERAYEIGEADHRNGALTYFLAEALRAAPADATWRDVMDTVSVNVTARFSEQHPQLEGARMDWALFGDRMSPPDPFVLASPMPEDGVVVDAGEAIGLAVGATLDVYPPGTKRFKDVARTGRIELTNVEAFRAEGKLLEGSLDAQSRAALSAIQPAGFRLDVLFEEPTSPLLNGVRTDLGALPFIRVDASPAEAQLRIRRTGSRFELVSRDQRVLGAVDADAAKAQGTVVELVKKWARWFGVLALNNPNPGLEVDLKLLRVGDPASAPPPADLESGKDKLEVTVTNTSGSKLYVVMLSLAENGAIHSIPRSGPPIELQGSIPFRQTFKAELSDDVTESTDVIKIIAATQPIPTDVFSQSAAPRGVRTKVLTNHRPLVWLLEDPDLGMARDLEPVELASWTMRSASFRVVRQSTNAPVVALHFATTEDARRGKARAAGRGVAAPVIVPGMETTLLVQRDAVPAAERVGTAFERAYALGGGLGAERAEPLFELDMPTPAIARGGRSGGAPDDDPRAGNDAMWSLREADVPAAWTLVRQKTGRPEGQEARGVTVAHVDTGYRPHPEIWTDAPETRTIWSDVGWDYFGDDADPTDDLLHGRPLDNPAHGIGSASAIASPAGSQTTGFTNGATGAGQGAKLVPLRVHRSVVHFSTTNLVKAIKDASGSDRTRAKVPTDFISLSMGGVPTWTLWQAVKQAEAQGYLIIAAAGNYVGTVVWPARFDSVLAVGATNYGCRPWAFSSHGPAVDVSAPGESVWRAMVDEQGRYVTSMGTGTTYGAATTAGVAALWFAYHRDSEEFKRLQEDHAVARVFRHLIAKTAWQPGRGSPPPGVECDATSWRASDDGAGIIDAAKLLAAPLEEPAAPRAAAAQSVIELPLFGSLYPAGTSTEGIRTDYQRLFGSTAAPEVGRYESEIMHHYVLDRAVATALDQIAVKGDRSEAAFASVRDALRARDLSPSLRGALR